MESRAESQPATAPTEVRAPSLWRKLLILLLGRPLATSEGSRHLLGPWVGVPALGLDALCSAAYAPEAALTLLLPLGEAGIGVIVPVTGVTVALSCMVYWSYRG